MVTDAIECTIRSWANEIRPVNLVTFPVKLSDCWRTPKDLADALGAFDLDPAGSPQSHIHAGRQYLLDRGEDGLALPWDTTALGVVHCSQARVFVNPPYSAPGPWAERLRTHRGPWAALVKLDPTTRWWAALMAGDGARYAAFRKRVRFEPPVGWTGPVTGARFASALVMGGGWTPPEALKGWLWI